MRKGGYAMEEKDITLTEKEKEIIGKLAHPMFDVDYVQEWINRHDNVLVNAPAALISIEVKGF